MQWCCNYEGFYLWLAWWETLVYDRSHGIYTTWREVKSGACRASWFIYINSIWNLRQKKIVSLGQSTSNWRYTLKSTQGTLHNWFKETLISLEQSRPCWVHAQNVTAHMMLRLQGGLRHHTHTPQMRNGALSCAPKMQPFLRTCSLTSHCVLASVPRGRSQLVQRMDLYFLIWEEMAPQPKKLRKLAAAANAAKSLQSCPTLCNSRDGSPPGSPVPGILQARTLEWVTISFSNAWKWKVKVKSLTRVQLFFNPMDCSLSGSSIHGIFQAGVGCHCLHQGTFLTQGLNSHVFCIAGWFFTIEPPGLLAFANSENCRMPPVVGW